MDCEFLSEPPPDYLCPICTHPLSDPYLTDCGHHFCYTCRGRLLASGKTECPECREQDALSDARLNKHLQRQVNSLKVRCQHHEVGCQWVGELRYLQKHLDPAVKTSCLFILLSCPFGCGKNVSSSAMKDHILSDCRKRSYVCEYCGYCNKFDIVTEQHYPVCEQFPVECPNACSVENPKRLELAIHLKEQCPLQVIQCPFTSAGCTVQLPRREMEEHEDNAMRLHLRMMMRVVQLKPSQDLPASAVVPATTKHCEQLEYLINLPSVEFTIYDFMKKKECDAEWLSPPFYSHPLGYKFSLVAYPNGIHGGESTHMSVYVILLEGENDDTLHWPVEASFMIDLLDWNKDKQGFMKMIEFNSALVTRKGIKQSLISSQFIPHSSLSYNSTTNTEYLQNDCVRLRVSKVILYSTALLNKTPSWQNPHNGYHSLYEFTLTEFTKRKQLNNWHFSSPFYTHDHGYKVFLRINFNYCSTDKGSYISVFIALMAGEYDDLLEWPFVGKFNIELLNWRGNKGHHLVTMPIAAKDGLLRITKGDVSESLGLNEFISHSSLAYNRITKTEYLREDCLRFRVNVAH